MLRTLDSTPDKDLLTDRELHELSFGQLYVLKVYSYTYVQLSHAVVESS